MPHTLPHWVTLLILLYLWLCLQCLSILYHWLRAENNYKAPTCPPHVHVGDFERSKITVNENGTVTVPCSVSGCDFQIILGRNIAHLYVVESGVKAK